MLADLSHKTKFGGEVPLNNIHLSTCLYLSTPPSTYLFTHLSTQLSTNLFVHPASFRQLSILRYICSSVSLRKNICSFIHPPHPSTHSYVSFHLLIMSFHALVHPSAQYTSAMLPPSRPSAHCHSSIFQPEP